MLRSLAIRLGHRAAKVWDERINTFYVQNNYPLKSTDTELGRVEGGFGITPRDHFNGLRGLLPKLQGLAILDNDGQNRKDSTTETLAIHYWRRYESENYFITPELLRRYAQSRYPVDDLFAQQTSLAIDSALAKVLTEEVFDGETADYETWQQSPPDSARLVWETKTQQRKLSQIAENFFRQLAQNMGHAMLLTKGELHQLVALAELTLGAEQEVRAKLDLVADLLQPAQGLGEQVVVQNEETLDEN
jgi:hypothetical protein